MKKIWRKVNKNHGLFALRYILKKRSNSFSLASSKESSHCILCYYSHCFPDLTCRGWSVLHCSYCTHMLFQQSFQGCLLATAQPTASAFHLLISVNILTQTVFSLSRLLVEFPSLGEMMICPRGSIVSVIPGSWLPNVQERLMPFNLQKVLNTENECYSPLWKWAGRQRGKQKLNKPCCLSHQRWKILWEQWEPVGAGTQRSGPELAALGWVPSSVTLPPVWPPANCSVPPISGGPWLSSSSLFTSMDCL